MSNWLIRFLLSLALAFSLLQGNDGQPIADSQNRVCYTQTVSAQESLIATTIRAQQERTATTRAFSAHKKSRSFQKLLVAESDDDDDNDEVDSSRKYIANNSCISSYFNTENFSFYTNNRLPFCQYASVLSSDRHLLFCTLRI